MQGSWQPFVGQPVRATYAISFAGGASPWLGRKGTVKKLLTARACMVLLEDDTEALFMFTRELTPLDEDGRLTA